MKLLKTKKVLLTILLTTLMVAVSGGFVYGIIITPTYNLAQVIWVIAGYIGVELFNAVLGLSILGIWNFPLRFRFRQRLAFVSSPYLNCLDDDEDDDCEDDEDWDEYWDDEELDSIDDFDSPIWGEEE